MSSRPCVAEECIRPAVARNLCNLHYSRWRISQNPPCSVDDCTKTSTAAGLCNAHYTRKRLHGDPLAGGRSPSVRKVADHPDGTRTCTTCNQRKPLNEFGRDKNASLGHRSQCKPCRVGHVQRWYRDNQTRQLDRARARYVRDIDKIRENDSKRYERDREKRIARATDAVHLRRVRLQRGRYISGITHKALRARLGDVCCYCGVTMAFEPVKGTRYNANRATIEHIVPISAGGAHDWDNVTLCCRQCNTRKNKTPLDQWLAKIAANPSSGDATA